MPLGEPVVALGEGLAAEDGLGEGRAVSAGVGDGLAVAESRPRRSSASPGELDVGSTGLCVALKDCTRCRGSGTKSDGTGPPSAPAPSILMGPV